MVPEIISESGQYCSVSLVAGSRRQAAELAAGRLRSALRHAIALYARTRMLDFHLADSYAAPDPDYASE